MTIGFMSGVLEGFGGQRTGVEREGLEQSDPRSRPARDRGVAITRSARAKRVCEKERRHKKTAGVARIRPAPGLVLFLPEKPPKFYGAARLTSAPEGSG
jgi:hypothetical protein